MEEVFEIADRLTVLRDGKLIGVEEIENVDRKKLINMMVGRKLEEEIPKYEVEIGEDVLTVEKLSTKDRLHNISFHLMRDEILDISGLVGSGRTELARAVLGIDKKISGVVKVRGSIVNFNTFRKAIKRGFGFVPEDRKKQGLVLGMTVAENISMAGISKTSKGININRKKENETAKKCIELLMIITPDAETEVKYLSGGNQQKVVLAKWIIMDSNIIIVDEPTRGIDVGAKTEIYKLLNQLAEKGKSIIMISSEMP